MSAITSGTCNIGGLSLNLLRQVESGFEGGDITAGKAARSWSVSAILTASDASALYNVANSWRAARLNDEDSVSSQTVGTTVAFNSVDCWFSAMPSITPLGAYFQADFTVVDAAQMLAIATREREDALNPDRQNDGLGLPDLGTFSFGTTIILRKPIKTIGSLPTLARTSTGAAYITGPLRASEVMDISGVVYSQSDYESIVAECLTAASSMPNPGSWYPISAPSFSAEHKLIDGLKVVEYTVNLALEKV